MARVTQIAKSAGQSRTHTYLLLRALQEKGLVAEVERGKIIHFVAEPPQRLLAYVERRRNELSTTESLLAGALPFLASLKSPLTGEPRVTMLKGREGMLQIYRDTLYIEDGFLSFFNPESMFAFFGENVAVTLQTKTARLRGRDLLVDNAAARRYVAEVSQDDQYQIRLLPKDVRFTTDTLVFSDTIAMFAYDADATIVRIQNRHLADALRAWHGALWRISRPTR